MSVRSNGSIEHDAVLAHHTVKLGLIINPIAGLGGPAALKGSDDPQQLRALPAADQFKRAEARAVRCLQVLSLVGEHISIFTAEGPMGGDAVQASGLVANTVQPAKTHSSAKDTQELAQRLVSEGVDVLLFVGGDGTARDICGVVNDNLPVLGIPAGVKMHSGVFAVSPEAAGEIIKAMVLGALVDVQTRDVRDIDEAQLQQGQVNSRFYGELKVPLLGHFVQATKQSGRECEELVVDEIVAYISEQLSDDTAYLIGAGTTTQALMAALHLPNTLLGVDVILAGEVVLQDANANEIEHWLARFSGNVVALLSITPHQGSLIGRGNQQLSPTVLRRIGRHNIWPLATKTKIRELQGRPLLIDSNDPALDKAWTGYIEVVTGYEDCILYPLGHL